MALTAELADGRRLEFPDGTDPAVVQATVKKVIASSAPAAPQESGGMQSGRQLGSSTQGFINTMQGPTFGFADELYGGLSAAGKSVANVLGVGNGQTFKQNYEEGRDTVRGATDQFRKDYPGTALGTSLAASAPTMLLGGAGPVSAVKTASTLSKALTAGKTGALYGAAGGAGESTAETLGGVLADTAKGAAVSGALGGAGQSVGTGIGAVGSNVLQRVSESSAADSARRKLAEALVRDARGIGASNPAAQVEARLKTLGPEATIADAAGTNTRQSLDTLATMSGDAKNATERLIHDRQASRSSRIVGAADEALGTQGKTYTASLEALDTAKKAASAPLYAQLDGVSVRVDKELNGILQAAKEAHGGAEKSALRRQEAPIDLSLIKAGDDVPFAALDKVKQSLWDLAEVAKRQGEKGVAADFNSLRTKLTQKMDAISPKDAGGSIYAQARNAYGGKAQLETAIEAGRTAMKADAIAVADLTKGMGASEMEAFKVGALQAIRDKVGTEAGQTSILKMWKEPATSDKLREIFGNDYRAFSAEVAKEARLKLLEQTGRGSQTAARLLGAGELDAQGVLSTAAGVAAGAATGHPVGAAARLANEMGRAWNQVKTPEATRNELARMLLLKGPAAEAELNKLPAFIANINREEAKRAALAGALAGQSQR